MVTSSAVRLSLATVFLALGTMVLEGCETTPSTPTVVLQRNGDHAFEWGRYEEAAASYRRIIDREPGDGKAQAMYGRCLMAMGEPARAADAKRGACEGPSDPRPRPAIASSVRVGRCVDAGGA